MLSFGVVPFKDESKQQEVDIRGAKAIIPGVNYVEDSPEEFWGYYPIFGAWEGRVMNETPVHPSIIPKLVDSFNNGYHNAGVADPLPIDNGHSSYEGGPQEALGYIVAVKECSGDKIITYTSSGAMVKRGLPEGTSYLMGQIAWLPEGAEKVASGQLPYISIAYQEENGIIVLQRPGLCTAPADESLPALTFTKENKMDENKMIDTNDPVYQAVLQALQAMTPEELQKVMDFLSGVTPQTETQTEPQSLNDEKITEILTKAFTPLIQQEFAKLAPQPVQEKELTEGEVAAMTAMFEAGVPAEKVESELKSFKMFSKLDKETAKNIVTMRYNRKETEGHAIPQGIQRLKDIPASVVVEKFRRS